MGETKNILVFVGGLGDEWRGEKIESLWAGIRLGLGTDERISVRVANECDIRGWPSAQDEILSTNPKLSSRIASFKQRLATTEASSNGLSAYIKPIRQAYYSGLSQLLENVARRNRVAKAMSEPDKIDGVIALIVGPHLPVVPIREDLARDLAKDVVTQIITLPVPEKQIIGGSKHGYVNRAKEIAQSIDGNFIQVAPDEVTTEALIRIGCLIGAVARSNPRAKADCAL